ncbi:MAG TPA: TlpA disulfide reductase family protein [Dyella sp.]|uniref:peroxiredoxin family protein n=1 Tax=Dyella sp. TaxID=1869338 RepID=UPI002BEB0E21|nr:TlpA disulfide reductase family protein [Dyella sp.]HTV85833.1 TlpA disulfide reductase family protein [Dyella sp.]
MFNGIHSLRHRITLAIALAIVMCPLHANSLAVGKPAPMITLNTLDGQHVSLADLHGKVVIVTFWATWCGPCREELPLLSHFASKHAKDGLVVLGFSLDSPDDLKQVQSVADTLSFKVGLLGDPHVPGYGRIWRLPVSFTVDRNGLLVDNGWEDKNPAWTQARLQSLVLPLLRSSP